MALTRKSHFVEFWDEHRGLDGLVRSALTLSGRSEMTAVRKKRASDCLGGVKRWRVESGESRAMGRPVYLVGKCARPRLARAPHLADGELLRQLC
jgi:hypothetical protein